MKCVCRHKTTLDNHTAKKHRLCYQLEPAGQRWLLCKHCGSYQILSHAFEMAKNTEVNVSKKARSQDKWFLEVCAICDGKRNEPIVSIEH